MINKTLLSEIQRFRKIAGLLGEDIELSDTPDFSISNKERLAAKIQRMPKVELTIGKRIKRGGHGKKGTYDEFKDELRKDSRQKIDALAQHLGITWNEMIIYYIVEEGYQRAHLYIDPIIYKLFAILGRDQEGKLYMYDRYGFDRGAYSKLYSQGGTSVMASYGLDMTPQDFK